jgi:hypothetical protein
MTRTLKRRVDRLEGNIVPELSDEELQKLSGPELILYELKRGRTLEEMVRAAEKLSSDEGEKAHHDQDPNR